MIGEGVGEIISISTEKNYNSKYIIKLYNFNNSDKFKNKKFIIYISKDLKLSCGDIIYFKGTLIKPESKRNDKGFDYERYLRQSKIYGIIQIDKVEIKDRKVGIKYSFYNLKNSLRNNLYKLFDKKEAGFLVGILLGEREDVSSDVRLDFSNSSLSHILAISGLHIICILNGIKWILNKFIYSKRITTIILIIFLIIFTIFIGSSPSCIRACIMMIILISSQILYRKDNFFTSLSIAFIIILLINFYNIENVGMWLSFLGVIGLYKIKTEPSIAIQIMVFPIILYVYKTVSFTFFISNFLVSFIIGPILVFGYVSLFFGKVLSVFVILEKMLLFILFQVANFIGNLSFSKVYVMTPSVIFFIVYYLSLFIILFIPQYKQVLKKYVPIILIVSLLMSFIDFDRKLVVHFLDVGQGDCTLITTMEGKNILIDGGENEGYDYGESVVMPYLLSHGIKSLDYIFISHFDTDHCGGIFFIMKNTKVKKIIIGRQFEINEKYIEFLKIANEKSIDIIEVEAGTKINMDRDVYFYILWPASNNVISDNSINNNSLVCKLVYKNFSMLFTGDIEELAEVEILKKYKDNFNLLNSTILKVAHHGSKTSSSEKFLEAVRPKIALIGVGKRNNFGHPSSVILESLEKIDCKIYRTDENGEISIRVNDKGKIWIDKMLN